MSGTVALHNVGRRPFRWQRCFRRRILCCRFSIFHEKMTINMILLFIGLKAHKTTWWCWATLHVVCTYQKRKWQLMLLLCNFIGDTRDVSISNAFFSATSLKNDFYSHPLLATLKKPISFSSPGSQSQIRKYFSTKISTSGTKNFSTMSPIIGDVADYRRHRQKRRYRQKGCRPTLWSATLS